MTLSDSSKSSKKVNQSLEAKEAFLAAAKQKQGRAEVSEFQKVVDAETAWYLDTFYLLSSSRQSGFGVGAIPLSEITNYGLVFDILHDLESFCQIIVRIDAAYIKNSNNDKRHKPRG